MVARNFEDLTGQRFGRLVVIERTDDHIQPNGSHVTMWLCQCDCGSVKIARASSLKSGNTKSCGCLQSDNRHKRKLNLVGKKFYCLTVIEDLGFSKNRDSISKCLCDCGNITIVRNTDLKQGRIKSCGCANREFIGQLNKTHGKSNSRLYAIRIAMIQRCYNSNNKRYPNYGGRGIIVCDEWLDTEDGFMNFYNWAMENGYDETAPRGQYTIDRIDVNVIMNLQIVDL